MTNTYGPEIDMINIVNSIFYHTPNGVWAPGIAFPTGTTLPTIDQTPDVDDPHEGDFFLLLTNPPHFTSTTDTIRSNRFTVGRPSNSR